MHEGKLPPKLLRYLGPLGETAAGIVQKPTLAQRLYLKALAGDTRPDLDIGNPMLKEELARYVENVRKHVPEGSYKQENAVQRVDPRDLLGVYPTKETRVLTGTMKGRVGDVPQGRPSLLDLVPEAREALNRGSLMRHGHISVSQEAHNELYNSLGTAYYSYADETGRLKVTDLYDFTQDYESKQQGTLDALNDFIRSVKETGRSKLQHMNRPVGHIDKSLQTIGNRVAKPFAINWPLYAGAAALGTKFFEGFRNTLGLSDEEIGESVKAASRTPGGYSTPKAASQWVGRQLRPLAEADKTIASLASAGVSAARRPVETMDMLEDALKANPAGSAGALTAMAVPFGPKKPFKSMWPKDYERVRPIVEDVFSMNRGVPEDALKAIQRIVKDPTQAEFVLSSQIAIAQIRGDITPMESVWKELWAVRNGLRK
jgi:hypothetical protein